MGSIRSLWDGSFCSAAHRRSYAKPSARLVRELTDLFGYEEPVTGERSAPSTPEPSRNETSLIAVAFVILCCAGILIPSTHQSQPAAAASRDVSVPSHQPGGALGAYLNRLIGSSNAPNVKQDFRGSLDSWKGTRPGSDWVQEASYVRPGKLRIWGPTQPMSNYEFEFMGHIEQRSLDWAFRATDSSNYYATKLTILRPDSTALVRFVVLDGHVQDYVELPLRLKLDRKTDYRIHLSAIGSRFLTSIDGQLVSSWTDPRISRGGVGFFSDAGEQAMLKWATLSERDSFMGRVLSQFSFFMVPGSVLILRP